MKKVLFGCGLLAVLAFGIPEHKVQVFMIGDSTMADKPLAGNPERGWGQLFPRFFTKEVSIRNYAVNGRSTKSFIHEGRWDTVLKYLRPDDYVFIQFGHNDEKINDTSRYAAPHGLYKQNLEKFVRESRAKGAYPILVTPVMRRKFDEQGKFVDQHGDYPDVVREVARELQVPLIDLHHSSQRLIESQGVEGSKKLFLWIDSNHYAANPAGRKDDTHFSEYGAALMASLVCAEMKEKKMPLAGYLLPSAFPGKDAFELPIVYVPHFRKDTSIVTDFGARPDGLTLNTKYIQDAIDFRAANGGGTVLIPPGLWLTGPIALRSNINLHAAAGALISFTPDRSAYPLVAAFFEGVEAARCQSPLSADDAENVAITGEGIFNGSGEAWRPMKKGKITDSDWKKLVASGGVLTEDKTGWYPSESALKGSKESNIGKLSGGKAVADFAAIHDFLRPNMLRFTRCKNVLLSGVHIENSPAWTLHLLMCDQVTLKNLTVKNPAYGQNTDGVDLESCRNVHVNGCSFDVGDDGICIKSGRDAEGRKRNMPTENVVVENCTVYHAHGGFVIGSEMSGGARNMYVSNCNFIGTDVGLRFKTTRGRGGVVENIHAADIYMKDIAGEAILFDMYYMAKDPVPLAGEKREMPVIETLPVNEGTPVFRNFDISNIVCIGADKGIFIRGIPESQVQQIKFSNLVLQTRQAIECIEAGKVSFDHVQLLAKQNDPLIYIQNSKELQFNNVKSLQPVPLFFSLNGNRCSQITVSGADWKEVQQKAAFNFGATTSSIDLH